MIYLHRELRRLWKVKVYEGDRNDPDVTIRTSTIFGINEVDVNRFAGGHVVEPPEYLCYVSWAEFEGGPVFEIDDPKVGPIGEPLTPSIVRSDDEDW